MPVLKSQSHEPYLRDAIVLDLGDLGRQAARLRMAAESKAAEIITAAEQQAQALVSQAEATGLEQGRRAGLEQGLAEGRDQGRQEALAEAREQLHHVQTAWADVAQQLDGARKQMLLEARESVLTFALRLSEKLVHRVIEVDPTVVVDQLAGALQNVLHPLDVTVRMHPADRSLLEQAMPELMSEFPRLEVIKLVEDETIARGGCSVTYGEGEIDATLETQMQRIVDLILPAAEPTEAQSPDPSPKKTLRG